MSLMYAVQVFLFFFIVHHATCNPCASPQVISGSSGLFTSFNFPNETAADSTCFWNITVPAGFVLKITFHRFSLSPADSHTDCRDAEGAHFFISNVASTQQSRDPFELCGQAIPNPVYTSTNSIQVRLKTVIQHGVVGFNASYEAITPDVLCPAMANLTDASGVITSPFYPRFYPNDQNCIWEIIASNGKRLKLEIEKTMDIPNCRSCSCDYLDIQHGFDSTGNPSGKKCGPLTTNLTYYSLQDRFRVQFSSDSSSEFQHRGFRAVYTQLDINPRNCPKAAIPFTASNGKFSSPGYPGVVPPGLDLAHNQACTWKITVAAGKRVKLNFTSLNFGNCSTPCSPSEEKTQCTHLDIYDGDSKSSSKLGRFCPGSAKEVKVSSGNQVFVEFESGFANNRGTGFEVQYSETLDDPSPTIATPTTATPTTATTSKSTGTGFEVQYSETTAAGATKTGALLTLTIFALAASLY
ncbi:tolloid-like protein 2 isoform X2 [Stylophora pistillata]|uniref:tolloid-like protein 2 isoform X2 n=1 Tax=Stylophora pistillata TaxID=50429 RepID=UPI000C04F313|nr:tolloid-like protein 2 isoform X2 [Stylophora pistillata]